MRHGEPVRKSSGNVFADIRAADADERLAKAELSRIIRRTIEERALTQAQAPHYSALRSPMSWILWAMSDLIEILLREHHVLGHRLSVIDGRFERGQGARCGVHKGVPGSSASSDAKTTFADEKSALQRANNAYSFTGPRFCPMQLREKWPTIVSYPVARSLARTESSRRYLGNPHS